MIRIRVTPKKNGQEVAWYRDTLGRRVGTSMRSKLGTMNWNRAREMMGLGLFSIQAILDRTAKGIGSDDSPMPALRQPKRKTRWSVSRKKIVEYGSWDTGYPAFKRKLGLNPIRDLRGPGGLVVSTDSGVNKRYRRSGTALSRAAASGRGHMLDDIRVTYVDDQRVVIGISNYASRVKALANEKRAPWWGWSPSDSKKILAEMARVLKMSFYDIAVSMGITGAQQLVSMQRGWLNAVRSVGRRAA